MGLVCDFIFTFNETSFVTKCVCIYFLSGRRSCLRLRKSRREPISCGIGPPFIERNFGGVCSLFFWSFFIKVFEYGLKYFLCCFVNYFISELQCFRFLLFVTCKLCIFSIFRWIVSLLQFYSRSCLVPIWNLFSTVTSVIFLGLLRTRLIYVKNKNLRVFSVIPTAMLKVMINIPKKQSRNSENDFLIAKQLKMQNNFQRLHNFYISLLDLVFSISTSTLCTNRVIIIHFILNFRIKSKK